MKAASHRPRPTGRGSGAPPPPHRGPPPPNPAASILIWSELDGSIQPLIPEGRCADVAYPQFSPASNQVAFVAPQSGLNGLIKVERPLLAFDALFGPTVAYAHGIPWDPWRSEERRVG